MAAVPAPSAAHSGAVRDARLLSTQVPPFVHHVTRSGPATRRAAEKPLCRFLAGIMARQQGKVNGRNLPFLRRCRAHCTIACPSPHVTKPRIRRSAQATELLQLTTEMDDAVQEASRGAPRMAEIWHSQVGATDRSLATRDETRLVSPRWDVTRRRSSLAHIPLATATSLPGAGQSHRAPHEVDDG